MKLEIKPQQNKVLQGQHIADNIRDIVEDDFVTLLNNTDGEGKCSISQNLIELKAIQRTLYNQLETAMDIDDYDDEAMAITIVTRDAQARPLPFTIQLNADIIEELTKCVDRMVEDELTEEGIAFSAVNDGAFETLSECFAFDPINNRVVETLPLYMSDAVKGGHWTEIIGCFQFEETKRMIEDGDAIICSYIPDARGNFYWSYESSERLPKTMKLMLDNMIVKHVRALHV